jgi:O-antigen/teichoic acid export membrane protein
MNIKTRRRKFTIVFAILSGFIVVPLYLRFIPADLYGAWLATGNILGWLTLVDPGISTVLQQRTAVAVGKRDTAELNALLTGGVLYSGVVSLLILALGWGASHFFVGLMNLPKEIDTKLLQQAFLLAVFGNSIMIFSFGISAFNVALQSSLAPGFVWVFATLGSLALTVVLLYRGVGLYALPIGTLFMGMALTLGNFCCCSWIFKQADIHYKFSLNGLGKLAKLSGYWFLAKSGNALGANMDAFMLTRYIGPETTATFVLTRKAADILRMFLERPAIAFQPAISHVLGSGEIEKANAVLLRLLRLILWLLGLVIAGLVVFNNEFVSLWVGPQFFAGWQVNTVLAVSLIATIFVNTLSSLCFALGNIEGNSIATLAQGLLAAPLIWLGAKYYGMIGVALAPLLSILAISLWYYPKVFAKLIKLTYSQIRALAHEAVSVTISATATCIALGWVSPMTWAQLVIAILAFSGIYLIILSLLSYLFRKEAAGFVKHVLRLFHSTLGS